MLPPPATTIFGKKDEIFFSIVLLQWKIEEFEILAPHPLKIAPLAPYCQKKIINYLAFMMETFQNVKFLLPPLENRPPPWLHTGKRKTCSAQVLKLKNLKILPPLPENSTPPSQQKNV